jgi:hypothetical protein
MKTHLSFLAAIAAVVAVSSALAAQLTTTAHRWTGVWQITDPNKPGGMITLADDGGSNGSSLSGIIVFYVKDRQTDQRIAIETRTIVNPHLEGNALAFQVKRILKPHLKGDSSLSEDRSDPTDIVDMTLTPTSEGKATLTCSKCGEASPTELVKQR